MKVLICSTGNKKKKHIPMKDVLKVVECDVYYTYPGLTPFIVFEDTLVPLKEIYSESGYAIILKNRYAILTEKIKGGEV